MIGLLSRLRAMVKARQVEGALRYFNGEITSNELLMVFEEEYLAGRRRFSPLRNRKLTFNLKHTEAVQLARKERAQAALKARNTLTEAGLRDMVTRLPADFDSEDVMTVFSVDKFRANYLIRRMRREGLVACKKRYRLHHGRMILTRLN